MDYVSVRRCQDGYELVDLDGKHAGCTSTLLQAYRFAEATRTQLVLEADVESMGLEQDRSRAARPRWPDLFTRIHLILRRGRSPSQETIPGR